jgi:hypothetical protein
MQLCFVLEIAGDESEEAHEPTLVNEGNISVVEYILLCVWDILNKARRMIEGYFLQELESTIPGHAGVD